MRRLKLIFGFTLALSVPKSGFGLDFDVNEIRGDARKNPVSVLQNRYFVKTFRPEFGIAVGNMLNEAYTNTSFTGFRASMFLSEWLGVEFQKFTTHVSASDDKKALESKRYRDIDSEVLVTPEPETNPLDGMTDYSAVLAPFYGKLNLMDQFILYSDLYFTTGISRVDTAQGTLSAGTIGAGQRFYFLKSLSFRVDFKDRIYTETRSNEKTTKHAYSVDFGMSYFFL